MALQTETATRACLQITKEIRNIYKNLIVHFIIHHEGQRKDALALAAQDIGAHPAAETAMHILKRKTRSEESTVLGTAVARTNIFFGLATQDNVLTLCTINLEQFETLHDIQRQAYHMAWHAIDAYIYHSNPDNRSGRSQEIIVRRRKALEMCAANLCADVFSAVCTSLHGDPRSIHKTAKKRSFRSIDTHSLHRPEYYPYAVACDAVQYAFSELRNKKLPEKNIVPTAFHMARDIGKTFEYETLKQWLQFSETSQDMAWRGYSRDHILSAAINTSPDTRIRATGFLVSEITGIQPCPILQIKDQYNPFADDSLNEDLHKRSISKIFEDVIAQGLRENSAAPFWEEAHQQNENLTRGQVVGWCAGALQKAGDVYGQALESGHDPELQARAVFEDEDNHVSWKNIRDMGRDVVKESRKGEVITLGFLREICENIDEMDNLSQSLERTLSEPSYQQKLENTHGFTPGADLAPKGLEINGPKAAPSMAPQQPTPTVSAAPAFGGKPQKRRVVQQQQASDRKDRGNSDDQSNS